MTIVTQAQNDVDNNTFKLAPINKKVKKTGSERRKKRQPYQVGEKDCSFVELCNHKELGRRICLRLGKYLGLVNIYIWIFEDICKIIREVVKNGIFQKLKLWHSGMILENEKEES